MYGGIEAVIEGGIHSMCLLWQKNEQEEDWGLLLVDVQNIFDEDNQREMMWAVQFKCPSGMPLTVNCYHHWFTLVLCDMDGYVHFLHSKEGVYQGYSLAMINYDIGILPLMCELRTADPHVTQPWYAYDASAGGNFAALQEHIQGEGTSAGLLHGAY